MAFDSGRTTVTTAGTRVALAASTPYSWCTVIALTENTSQVNVGNVGVVAATGSTQRGIPLMAGDSVTLYHGNLATLYIDSRVNGEGVTYLYG